MRLSVEAEPTELADLFLALMGQRPAAPSPHAVAPATHTVAQVAAPHAPASLEAPHAPIAGIEGDDLAQQVKNIVYGEMHHVLDDVEFRVAQAYDVERRTVATADGGTAQVHGKVYAEDLHLGRHIITGYTITPNSPTAGNVAWASLHIVYNGTDYTITAGNTSTFNSIAGPYKYVWFDPTISTSILQQSNTKPTLTAVGSALIFVNNGGTPVSVTEESFPSVVANNAVDTGAIQAKAITAGLLGDKAVGTGQIADNAITSLQVGSKAIAGSNIADNAVNTLQLASNAVDSTILKDGAVSTSAKLANGVVNTLQLAGNAVDSTKIAGGAVGTTQLAGNAVDSTKLADGAVSTSAKLGLGVVANTNIATGAVKAAQLNVLQHFLY